MDLVEQVRGIYGWGADVVVTPGPRGALGRIWRVDVDGASYALKEIFAGPPSDAVIEAELAFARRAAEAGVRLPASHADHTGRYVHAGPRDTWLRLYDWVDLRPVEPTAAATPAELGTLLARLHRCAAAVAVEPSGESPVPWYDSVPTVEEIAAESTAGAAWADRLADRLSTVPELCAAVSPADSGALIVCHRDLHPENVYYGPTDELVVVDWDNFGPAMPARELAQVMFDWFCDGPTVDLAAVRRMYDAYLRAGGPGRITQPADFTMLLATRLNFLRLQLEVATDPTADGQRREWAVREIDESLRILPTARQLSDALEALTA